MAEQQSEREIIINENGSWVAVFRSWLSQGEADNIFRRLLSLNWSQTEVIMYGKPVKQPRLTYFCGQTDEVQYHNYSGASNKINDWDPDVLEINNRLQRDFQQGLNSCLLNYYRDGNDYIGYHSDKEADGGYYHKGVVATVSLGGSRDFYFKDKHDTKRDTIKVNLRSGDLVIMAGTCQSNFTHSIPKRAKADPRISLTYRKLSG